MFVAGSQERRLTDCCYVGESQTRIMGFAEQILHAASVAEHHNDDDDDDDDDDLLSLNLYTSITINLFWVML